VQKEHWTVRLRVIQQHAMSSEQLVPAQCRAASSESGGTTVLTWTEKVHCLHASTARELHASTAGERLEKVVCYSQVHVLACMPKHSKGCQKTQQTNGARQTNKSAFKQNGNMHGVTGIRYRLSLVRSLPGL